jgi:hypothetical protein
MAKKQVNLELKLDFGVLERFGVFVLCFETDRMRGKNVGFAYIRYACLWLVSRIYFKCPLLKSRMCELYSVGCLEGVWFWSPHFFHIRFLRHGQLPWLRPRTWVFWSFCKTRLRNNRVAKVILIFYGGSFHPMDQIKNYFLLKVCKTFFFSLDYHQTSTKFPLRNL